MPSTQIAAYIEPGICISDKAAGEYNCEGQDSKPARDPGHATDPLKSNMGDVRPQKPARARCVFNCPYILCVPGLHQGFLPLTASVTLLAQELGRRYTTKSQDTGGFTLQRWQMSPWVLLGSRENTVRWGDLISKQSSHPCPGHTRTMPGLDFHYLSLLRGQRAHSLRVLFTDHPAASSRAHHPLYKPTQPMQVPAAPEPSDTHSAIWAVQRNRASANRAQHQLASWGQW